MNLKIFTVTKVTLLQLFLFSQLPSIFVTQMIVLSLGTFVHRGFHDGLYILLHILIVVIIVHDT
jgi:hypothetical protein